MERIPGIYNYCDKWCERCSFTSRCAVYADEQGLSNAEKDIKNQAFWERLSDNFAKAFTMLHEKAKELGVDLDEISRETEEDRIKRQRKDEANHSHPLVLMGLEYSDLSRKWCKQVAIQEKADQIAHEYELGIRSAQDAKNEALIIKDCLEVINWYETLLPAKLMRAISGKADDGGWAKENGFQSDFDGSAKIAIISIDRSMQAWLKLYERIPAEQDHILSMLALLEKMKKMTTAEFPGALTFVRPGFDE